MENSKCNAKYRIVITTSEAYKESGFGGKLHIRLIGADGRETAKKCLSGFFSNDFGRGKTALFNYELLDVGVPEFIKIELSGFSKDDWACDDVVVTYHGTHIHFPIYDWIENEITVPSGKAFTYCQVSPQLKEVRLAEVAHAKERYQWLPRPKEDDIGWGIPRYVDAEKYKKLPKIFKRTEKQQSNFESSKAEGLLGTILGTVNIALNVPRSFTIEDFKRFYQQLHDLDDSNKKVSDPPYIMDDKWESDVEFGRQQIMGVTPLLLKRCSFLPEGCRINDTILGDILQGSTLDKEMQSGKVFIGDFSTVFNGVIRNENKAGDTLYCPAATGLFHVNQDQNLVPIAIQLFPDDLESIFTPKDSREDWLLAKMYYRVATSNLHEWYCHFLLTHNAMEPFGVALFRNIPRSHPVYKLLRPHLQTVSAINTDARDGLIGPKSLANLSLAILGIDMARTGYKNFKMDELVLPKVLKERGLDDTDVLPRNYFRDDALKLWSIINKFVGTMLNLYYSSDKDVADDVELQNFARDVALEGLGWQDGDTKGMRTEIKELEYLIELCTALIYTSSVQHAAVNFPQFQNYQFIPNSPAAMRLPPHKKGEANSTRILQSLPDADMAVRQVTIAYALSQMSPDEIFLGQYPMKLFTEHRALVAIEEFQEELKKHEECIIERNAKAGDDAYDWLLPSRVPNSIAV